MSFIRKIVETLAGGSSSSLQKIKIESERRRVTKSNLIEKRKNTEANNAATKPKP